MSRGREVYLKFQSGDSIKEIAKDYGIVQERVRQLIKNEERKENTNQKSINRVIPCVCTKHAPTVADSCDYGMPILVPHNVNNKNGYTLYWRWKCPNCGRGGLEINEEKSVYLALKVWNQMQEELYNTENREIVFSIN